jgi:hypothetical protein
MEGTDVLSDTVGGAAADVLASTLPVPAAMRRAPLELNDTSWGAAMR